MYIRYPLSLRQVDEIFVRIAGENHYLWRTIDQEGEVLEAYVAKTNAPAHSKDLVTAHYLIDFASTFANRSDCIDALGTGLLS